MLCRFRVFLLYIVSVIHARGVPGHNGVNAFEFGLANRTLVGILDLSHTNEIFVLRWCRNMHMNFATVSDGRHGDEDYSNILISVSSLHFCAATVLIFGRIYNFYKWINYTLFYFLLTDFIAFIPSTRPCFINISIASRTCSLKIMIHP